jgi:hypothetical protein
MQVRRIETGTPEGDALGFTGDLFSGWLEVYNDNRLYLHYIISRIRGEGNVQALIRGWLDCGYDVHKSCHDPSCSISCRSSALSRRLNICPVNMTSRWRYGISQAYRRHPVCGIRELLLPLSTEFF